MASQGAFSPSSAVNTTSTTRAWNNPSNVASSDNVYATITLNAFNSSDYIDATDFGFSIPSGATINGIVVEVEKKASASAIEDDLVKLLKAGSPVGTDKAAGAWATTDTYTTYGSSTDLWGTTWTDAEINASNFGFRISALNTAFGSTAASIDHIRITVYYTTVGNASASPSVLSAVLSLATAAIITSSVIASAVQPLTFSIPTPNVSVAAANAGTPIGLLLALTKADVSASIAPGVQVLTFSIPSPTVPQHVTVSPSAQTATFSLPVSETDAVVGFEPNPVSATFSVPSPTVTAIQNVSVSPVAVSPTFSVPPATVLFGQVFGVNTVTLTVSTQSPTIQYGVTVSPPTTSGTFSIQTPAVGLGAEITASVQTATFSLSSRTVSLGLSVSSNAQSLAVSTLTPSFVLDYKVLVNPLSAVFSIPQVRVPLWSNVNRPTDDNWSPTSRPSNDSYNQVSRPSDDDWTQITREP